MTQELICPHCGKDANKAPNYTRFKFAEMFTTNYDGTLSPKFPIGVNGTTIVPKDRLKNE